MNAAVGTLIARHTYMSATRPAVPRPITRTTPIDAAPVSKIPESYVSAPPVIRERVPTLDLEDDDIVESQPQRGSSPPPMMRRSNPPPPPSTRPKAVSAPAPAPAPAPPVVDSVPPPPASSPRPVMRATPIESRVTPVPSGSQLDPSDLLFDGMYELNFVDTAWEAAGVCAGTLARALGARAVVIHSHDLKRRELRAIGAFGDRTTDLLGMVESSDDDLVASAAICNERSVTMRFDGELPRLAPKRLGVVGAPRTVVAVPAMAWGRVLAIIEVIDADDRFDGRVADAAAYVAERLAEFLSERVAA